MLKLMVDFLQLFLPAVEANQIWNPEGNTITESLQKSIDESNLKQENGVMIINGNLIFAPFVFFLRSKKVQILL